MRTARGTLRLTDALAFADGARGHEIGHSVPHALVRLAEVLEGEVAVDVEFVPRLEYGLAVPRVVEEAGGLATLGGPSACSCAATATCAPTAAAPAAASR